MGIGPRALGGYPLSWNGGSDSSSRSSSSGSSSSEASSSSSRGDTSYSSPSSSSTGEIPSGSLSIVLGAGATLAAKPSPLPYRIGPVARKWSEEVVDQARTNPDYVFRAEPDLLRALQRFYPDIVIRDVGFSYGQHEFCVLNAKTLPKGPPDLCFRLGQAAKMRKILLRAMLQPHRHQKLYAHELRALRTTYPDIRLDIGDRRRYTDLYNEDSPDSWCSIRNAKSLLIPEPTSAECIQEMREIAPWDSTFTVSKALRDALKQTYPDIVLKEEHSSVKGSCSFGITNANHLMLPPERVERVREIVGDKWSPKQKRILT